MMKMKLFKLGQIYFSLEKPNLVIRVKRRAVIKVKKEKKAQQIKGIEQVIESEELDTYYCVCSLTVTEDKRIASGGPYDIDIRRNERERYIRRRHMLMVLLLFVL